MEVKVWEMSTAYKVYSGLKDYFKSSVEGKYIFIDVKYIKGLKEVKWEDLGLLKYCLVYLGCGDGIFMKVNLYKFMRVIVNVI